MKDKIENNITCCTKQIKGSNRKPKNSKKKDWHANCIYINLNERMKVKEFETWITEIKQKPRDWNACTITRGTEIDSGAEEREKRTYTFNRLFEPTRPYLHYTRHSMRFREELRIELTGGGKFFTAVWSRTRRLNQPGSQNAPTRPYGPLTALTQAHSNVMVNY
jgi:hypothetical protein